MGSRIELSLVLALSLCATACGSKATGQTVAVVNGEEVTLGELNAELAQANIPANAAVDKQAIRAQALQSIISRRLLAQQARQQGIDKTPDFIAKQRQMTEQLLIGLAAQRQNDTAKLPDASKMDAFMRENPGMFQGREVWSLQQIQFNAPADKAAIAGLKNAHTLDQITATLTQARIPFQRGQTRVDTATIPTPVLQQIAKLPAGEPFIVPQGGTMVASVITAKTPNPTTAEQSRQVALQGFRRNEADARLKTTLDQLRGSAKIEYQAGYAPKAAQTAAPGKTN